MLGAFVSATPYSHAQDPVAFTGVKPVIDCSALEKASLHEAIGTGIKLETART
jgi:hypothetical protein